MGVGNTIKFNFDPGQKEITSLSGLPKEKVTNHIDNEKGESQEPEKKEVIKEAAVKAEGYKEPNEKVGKNNVQEKAQEKEKLEPNKAKEEEGGSPDAGQTPKELSDEQFLDYYNKKNNTNFKNLSELSQVKEVERVVEKEAELDDEVAAFAKYKQETGRSLHDYLALNRDYSQMSALELGRDLVRKENEGLSLNNGDADILLAEKIGVDPEDLQDLDGKELLKLKSLSNKHLRDLKTEQEKYRQPEKKQEPKAEKPRPVGEVVKLSNGQVIPKDVYEQQRKNYIESREKAINSIDKVVFEIPSDSEGNLSYSYDYKPEDKHSMLSLTEDVSSILPRYEKEGAFDHKAFNEDLWWSVPENRGKAIKSLLNHARSEGIDSVVREEKNVNFDRPAKPNKKETIEDGYSNNKLDEMIRTGSRNYGVKYIL